MANPLFRNEFTREIWSALQAFEDASLLDHKGLRGRVREIFAERLLKPVLPPGVEIGTGNITDVEGHLSQQMDIVVYSRQILPSWIYGYSTGLFPVEACLYAVEVKSKFTATEVKDCVEKAKQLMTLRSVPTFFPLNPITPEGLITSTVIPIIFAFSTDLTEGGKNEIDRYREHDRAADENPMIRVICIPKRGYWFFDSLKKWVYHEPTPTFDEVIDFIGGFVNTVPELILTKGLPKFGHYLIERRKINEV